MGWIGGGSLISCVTVSSTAIGGLSWTSTEISEMSETCNRSSVLDSIVARQRTQVGSTVEDYFG